MDSSLAVEHWKTVAAETACLGEAEMFSREIKSPMQLQRPHQQKPVFPGCCINSSSFKHQSAACLCGSFQFVYYTTFWKCNCLPFFFLGILHQSGFAAKTTLAQTSIQLTSIVMENLKTAFSYVLHSCMTVLCSLS